MIETKWSIEFQYQILDAALRYGALGYRVFPITPGDKKPPLIDEWQRRASSDPEQIRAWWLKWPTANIGLVADDLVVVDVDPRNGGDKGLEGLEALNGPLPATGPAVRTGGGGVHLYFRSPGVSLSSSTSKVATGVDIKTGLGYVVVPPSVTTGPYKWIRDLEQELPKMPGWLLEKLTRKNTKPFTVPAEVTPGSRNGTLYKLGRLLRAKGLPAVTIGAALIAANQDFKPPLPDAEVELLIANVLSQPDRPGFTPPDTSQPDQPNVTPSGWRWGSMLRGSAITRTRIVSPDALVKGLFTRNLQHAIVGASGSLKSWLLWELGIGVAHEQITTFLGQPIMIHGPVLLESWEQGQAEDTRRSQKILYGYGIEEASDNLIQMSNPAVALTDEGDYQARLKDMTDAGVVLYAFDSLSEGCGIELNDNTAYTAWWRSRISPILQAGITVVFTHLRGHVQNKPGMIPDRDSVFRGATQIRALTQAAIECKAIGANSSMLRHNKHRDTPELPLGTLNLIGGFEEPGIRLSLVQPLGKDEIQDAKMRTLLGYLRTYPKASKRKIKAGIGMGQDTVDALIEEAARKGLITALGPEKSQVWSIAPESQVRSEYGAENSDEESDD